MIDSETLLEVRNLKKHFKIGRKSIVRAVDDVSFDVFRGETFGLVGESGCGKTTCGKTILGLHKPTGGEVIYDGMDVHALDSDRKKDFTKIAQIVFQDPYSSLDPRMTVGDIIGEGMDIHHLCKDKGEREERVFDLLQTVGLNREHINRFPHEFSGGQRQRIGIARALAVEPEFIVCDEPISALDVSIQAQIVNLLMQLQREKQLTYLFITHNLAMIKYISDRVGVMYLGNLVELAGSKQLYEMPYHPYTQGLLLSVPVPDPRIERRKETAPLRGEIPTSINPPPGCRFASRCDYAKEVCYEVMPPLTEIEDEHFVACHLMASS